MPSTAHFVNLALAPTAAIAHPPHHRTIRGNALNGGAVVLLQRLQTHCMRGCVIPQGSVVLRCPVFDVGVSAFRTFIARVVLYGAFCVQIVPLSLADKAASSVCVGVSLVGVSLRRTLVDSTGRRPLHSTTVVVRTSAGYLVAVSVLVPLIAVIASVVVSRVVPVLTIVMRLMGFAVSANTSVSVCAPRTMCR